ncbi:cytochrome ubiquinol oxidase subunit I [Oceanibium sediminis]|uniref:cytochrome ubiquinol oxidase subunit I n=1 Tax=Oceanibium sediminis TaxID=2026339 RepID=UPI000DD30D34|nr:cytochrome ubiquinol oxidase subunit I [Oceanibium sediminis]
MDALMLARIQFAANISFHILFPTITIALGWFLLYLRVRFNRSGDPAWMAAYRFWVKVFALSFGLGVVSGITMSFQFGTNWPGYMETVGNIAGPLLAYEIMTAFFLEAVFLGIMLFGWNKVSGRVHTLATFLVAFGTTMSAFWILVLNSWMHTPAGYEVIDGQVFATDWWAVIFNPSMPYRLVHMLIASFLTVSFLIAGISALRWLWGDRSPGLMKALRAGVFTAALLIPAQILVGDLHGLNTLEHQPAKVAAMEANWDTGPNVPLVLFGIPDEEARETRFELTIPNGASLILTHHADGVVPGLNDFVTETGEVLHPPVLPVFFSFRIMVGIGLAMLAVSWALSWRMWRHANPGVWGARALVLMTFSGWVATLSGWYVTEIGRQPWLVTGVLDTATAAADHPAPILGLSLSLYLAIYGVLLAAYIGALLHLARKATQGQDKDLDKGITGPMPVPAE